MTVSLVDPDAEPSKNRLVAWWDAQPLYLRIAGAVVLGVVTGLLLGENAADLAIPSKLVLRVLGALAPPLILLAVVQALMQTSLPARQGARLLFLLVLNTVVAIFIGLAVANVVQPGRWVKLPPQAAEHESGPKNALTLFLDNVPKSLLGPLTDEGKVLAVIMLAVAFGIALRRVRQAPLRTVEDLVNVALSTLIVVLHWVIELVPLAVFGLIASIVGVRGFHDFLALGGFVLAVLLALALQTTYYLVRVRLGSWVRPRDLLRGSRDALLMAFSTGSSTATMPVTYACLRERVGLRQQSASLGALVGSNFNNDGTALYEAMAALFVAQLTGQHLTLMQQGAVVLMAVVASVGAAGIPEAGLVTMTLVFDAVGLDKSYIAILLTVDWFLDRARTAINVMGDMNVSCLLDGKEREKVEAPASAA